MQETAWPRNDCKAIKSRVALKVNLGNVQCKDLNFNATFDLITICCAIKSALLRLV